MALIINLKSVDYLSGKADRLVKLTFRGHSYESNVIRSAKRVAYFGQTFEWPLARGLRADETITLQLFNYNKYLNNKLIGTYSFYAQQLMQDGKLSISDALVDGNNKMLETAVCFDVNYYSPDGRVGDWSNKTDFMSPVSNPLQSTDTVDGDNSGNNALDDLQDLTDIGVMEAWNTTGLLAGEDTASQDALIEQQFEMKKSRPDAADFDLLSFKDYEVRVTVIKGEAIAGLDVDPVIRVDVGDQMRYTAIKQSTNTPYYNEYMVFNFTEPPAVFLDKIITISAYHAYGIPGRQVLRAGNMVAGKKLIGLFKCDLGTVYSSPGHQFYHKWATLLDPKDTGAGPKGYIKCDIVICGRGAAVKPPPGITDDDTDDIKKQENILLPAGVPIQRQRAVYAFTVFRAEDLPRTDLGVFASVQKAVTNKDIAFIDPYIRISFAGQVGKTSVIKSYNPEWKEVLLFTDLFPPLCNRIKIELCDSEFTSDEIVATHFIEMAQIMDPGGDSADGILPTFGPSWINLYGSPRKFKVVGGDMEEVNQGIGEGAAFRGRLLLSLETTIVEGVLASKSTVKREKLLRSSGVMDNYKRQPFLLFSTLFEASMIDRQLENKPVHFEISIGKFGNTLDARSGYNVFEDSDEDSDDDEPVGAGEDKQKTQLLKQKMEERAVCLSHSVTKPQCIVPMDPSYGYFPARPEKPCLFAVGLFEDFRKRILHSNILTRISESLDEALLDVKEMINADHEFSHRRLKGALDVALRQCDEYLRMCPTLRTGAGAGKTNLDKYRMKSCRKFIEGFRQDAAQIRKTTTAHTIRLKYLEVKELGRKLRQLAREPQHALPDVLIWLICEKQRVAYHRFSAADLIYSNEELQCGKDCGKRQTVFLRKPGRKSLGEEGWTIQAKLDLYLWLGQYERSRHEKPYLANLPTGFEEHFDEEDADKAAPPSAIVYENSYVFQLRAYMYQARSLIGSDATGLSDPFARVIFSNQCRSTQIIKETLCPVWDETLIFDEIYIYGVREDLIRNPPTVTVEVYDHDFVGEPEFLGRAIATPKIVLEDEARDPISLDWLDIYRGSIHAGELLVAFELIEGEASYLPELPSVKAAARPKTTIYSIPPEIRPTLIKYRLEVLFRGVREMKKIQLMAVKQPKIVIECAGKPATGSAQIVESQVMKNSELNSNFDDPVKTIDIFLPDDITLWPPLSIRCIECRTFGRQLFVGVCTVDRLDDFLRLTADEESKQLLALENNDSPQKGDSVAINVEADVHNAMTNAGNSVIIDVPDVIPLHPDASAVQPGVNASTNNDHIVEIDRISILHADGTLNATVAVKSKSEPSISGQQSIKPAIALDAATTEKDREKRARQKIERERAERHRYRELIVDCDWWSKYYVSKEDLIKMQKEKLQNKDNDSDEDEDDSDNDIGFDMVDYTKLNLVKLLELQKDAKKKASELEAEDEKKKRKKRKKRNRRKKAKQKLKNLKGKINKAFSKEEKEEEVLEFEEETAEDKSFITRIKVYDCPLEEVAGFGKFEEHFKTFRLYRGKKSLDDEEDNDDRLCGYFKGNFAIYKVDEDQSDEDEKTKKPLTATETIHQMALAAFDSNNSSPPGQALVLLKDLPPNRTIEVKVMVYIIKAVDLHPVDFNGLADPYLVVRCGRQKKVDKENKQLNQLNPVFGRIFEFDVEFPLDSWLDIEVWDYDSLSADDIIGSTSIDLENRFFSRHRARCGLQQKYEIFGYNIWRDPLLPSQILEQYCREAGVPEPFYGAGVVTIDKQEFIASDIVQDETGEELQTREHMALEVLKNWHNITGGWKLVEEHIETRPLFCDERPGEQGRIEMWIDMFPKDSPLPTVTLDISPRKPESYELRCIIYDTDDVTLDDVNPITGEKSSDIYVRGYVLGPGDDKQDTDIHYRSLTGEGNFNWRFVFPFDYYKAEEKIVFRKKESFLDINSKEYKVPPVLTLQIWDADLISSDDMLGSISLNLTRLVRPAKDSKFCSLKMLEATDKSAFINLFKHKRCKGWWPCTAVHKPDPDEDEDVEDDGEEKLLLKGKVLAELHLVTAEEAEKTPVGLGRKEPEPLPLPNRPDSSFLWFLNPMKTLRYIFWRNYKWLIVKILLFALLIAFFVMFIYAMPGYTVMKLWNL